MDARTKRIATVAIIALTVMIIIGFIVTTVLFKTDSISWDSFIIYSYFLSFTLTTLVIIYGALMMSERSSKERYLEYIEEKEKKD